jgi:hypothetical protein
MCAKYILYLNTVELLQSDTWVFRHPVTFTKVYGPKVYLGYIFLQETLFLKLIGDLLNRIYINYVNFPVLSGTDESL